MKLLRVKLVNFPILICTNSMQINVTLPIHKVKFTLHFDRFIKFLMSISHVRDVKFAVKFGNLWYVVWKTINDYFYHLISSFIHLTTPSHHFELYLSAHIRIHNFYNFLSSVGLEPPTPCPRLDSNHRPLDYKSYA